MKLEVKNLVKKFKSTVAVNNISFEIEKNNTLGLLGPNGCGKTTSIGMMLGLITPTKGEIFVDNIKLNSENRIKLLSLMNFASPYIELPKKLTVRQNLEVYARLYGISEKVERIEELIEDLNLGNFINKNTGELSSGQKNRVSLAKSLINKPKLLFLDEPTASLDPDVGDFVREYLEKYKNNNELIRKILFYKDKPNLLMKIGNNGKKKYHKYFNNKLVCDYVIKKNLNINKSRTIGISKSNSDCCAR